MRWFSIRAQICASRPSAVTKKSGARSARKRRWKSRARAAASNAGPRLAEVAGSARRSERSADIGRDGIMDDNYRQLLSAWATLKPTETKGFRLLPKESSRFQPISTSKLCLIHDCAAECYEFLHYALKANPAENHRTAMP